MQSTFVTTFYVVTRLGLIFILHNKIFGPAVNDSPPWRAINTSWITNSPSLGTDATTSNRHTTQCSACRMKLEKMLILDTVLENMVPMINGKSISRKSQLVPN